MKFITNEPTLLIEKNLIIADLHLGIEYEFYKSGVKIPSQTEKIKNRIEKILVQSKAKKLIILGDVKHKVPGISKQELREIPAILEYFKDKIAVEIIPGNHDGGLKNLINLKIWPAKGLKLDDYFLTHGHCWPSKDFLTTKYVIIGHQHPQIEFKDSLGYKFTEPVWLKAELIKNKIIKKYGKVKRSPKLIVMPVFNEFAGGISLNKISKKELLGPIIKCANLPKAKIYLLDGTFLGELGKL